MNRTPTTPPATTVPKNAVPITLSNGKKITLRPQLAIDRIRAERIVGKDATPTEMTLAILAQVITVDDKPVVYEDLQQWEMTVLTELDAYLGK